MIPLSIASRSPVTKSSPDNPKIQISSSTKLSHLKPVPCSFHRKNPNIINNPAKSKTHPFGSVLITPDHVSHKKGKINRGYEERRDSGHVGSQQMLALCGFGYWMQGFRSFPWLALNFHMAHNLNLHPSQLQLLQISGNLPMVAKPLYGLLSDAFYIGGAHRVPYILMGVFLQVLGWGPLALIPVAREALPILISCILISNLGASITEVANDALVTEYGQKNRIGGLQSYAFMALAVGGILGNLLGGCFLQKTPPKTMFLVFSVLLSLQLATSSIVREKSLGLLEPSNHNLVKTSIWENTRKQLSDLKTALNEDSISHPLTWIVASIATVPVLSGSIFCYQTQCLHLDPSIIGTSRVIGQVMLLSMTVLYDRYWKEVPMRKLVGAVQFLYASSLLLDFVLVRQINLKLGISNEVFACCFSGLAEILAQFKLLPFSMLLASLCPRGCEGSLTSFLASSLCLSSIASGLLGVGFASLIGITSGNYSSLPMGILIQFLAALLPLGWIHRLPMSKPIVEKERRRGMSKRTRKKRRVGRVVFCSVYVYHRERESDSQR
uniref:FBT8 n=1 Tax=Populus tomentosa TaxID=118781 RepID=A0A162HQF7_POPTO|nr:FBT8 [Populus tomentosa]